MGICYSYTGELEKSLSCFSRSLEIRPDYHDALQWKVRLSTRIADEASGTVRSGGASSASTVVSEDPHVSHEDDGHEHGHSHGGGGAADHSHGHDHGHAAGFEADGKGAGSGHKGVPAPGAVVA